MQKLRAVRQLSPKVWCEVLASSTLYSSDKPCVMCAALIFCSGIGQVVFGLNALQLRVFKSDVAQRKDAELSCRNVSGASARAIARIEPIMLDECSAPRIRFWKPSVNSQFSPTQ